MKDISTTIFTFMTITAGFIVWMLWGWASIAQAEEADRKILVAYFSHSGNTREIANQIHATVGGDLFEVVALEPYPEDYRKCTEVAKREQENDARPPLKSKVENMDAYDTIFIGYPIWWGTIPMALFTFFESHDFSGKTIVPFCTHGGSGLGRSASDIARLCPGATVREGLAIRGSGVRSAQNEVAAWLQKQGMAD